MINNEITVQSVLCPHTDHELSFRSSLFVLLSFKTRFCLIAPCICSNEFVQLSRLNGNYRLRCIAGQNEYLHWYLKRLNIAC